MANYPTYLAAAPNGDLYVSSDGNGSGGRDPGRGRVLRLRDTDNDGRADEVTEFVQDVDSPRGLLWDHDRLYLLHPPHITRLIMTWTEMVLLTHPTSASSLTSPLALKTGPPTTPPTA